MNCLVSEYILYSLIQRYEEFFMNSLGRQRIFSCRLFNYYIYIDSYDQNHETVNYKKIAHKKLVRVFICKFFHCTLRFINPLTLIA